MTASPPCAAESPLSGLDLGKGTLPLHSQEAELLRQYVIVHLLQKVCAFFDHTPRTFFEHFLQMVRYGILSHDALSGSVPPLGLPVVRPALPAPKLGPLLPNNRPWQPVSSAPCSTPQKEQVPKQMPLIRSESWDRALPALRRRVSRFEKDFLCVKRLGAGAFGEVWHCRHRIDGRDYAIKVVRFHCHGSEMNPHRVLREVQCWSRLSHPNIARYNSAWVESEWESGGSWPLPPSSSAGELLPIAEGTPAADGLAQPHGPRRHGSACGPQAGPGSIQFANPVNSGSAADLSHFSTRSEPSDGGFVWSGRAPEEKETNEQDAGDGYFVPCTDPSPCDFVRSLESARYDFTLYIQSELCRQETLADWLHQRNADAARGDYEHRVREALEIFGQCLHALDHVHSSGCVHRDLKPSNVFFSLDGIVRLGDFGLAKDLLREPQDILGERKHGSGVVGTLSYSSPEQMAVGGGSKVGFEADIFSLGLIAAELFCPAGTQMERVKLFEQLRNASRSPELAADAILACCPFPTLRRTVTAMTQEDPESRPSAKVIIAQYLPELLTEVAATLGQDVILNMGGWDSPPSSSPVMVARAPPSSPVMFGDPGIEGEAFGLPSAGVPEALRVSQLTDAIVGVVSGVLEAPEPSNAFQVVREAIASGPTPPATFEDLQNRLEALPTGESTITFGADAV